MSERSARFSPERLAELGRLGLCAECGQEPPLCDTCGARVYGWLVGSAASRGQRWAEEVLRAIATKPTLVPWPSWDSSAQVRDLATRCVGDQKDESLRRKLARACYDAAAKRWAELARSPAQRRQVLGARPERPPIGGKR